MASPKPDDPVEINVGIYETLLFLLFNLIYLMIGFIFWHVLWVTRHGVEIPNLISKNTITYFSSRNFSLVLKEIWERMWKLDRNYLTSAIGYEAFFSKRKRFNPIFISLEYYWYTFNYIFPF